MKQLGALLVLMTCLLFSASLGVFSLMGLCQFSQYVEYDGILDRTTDHIVLMTDDNSDPVKLSFAYDQDSELIISDFSHVSVKGYYNNMNNVLKVEEIDVQSDYYYGP